MQTPDTIPAQSSTPQPPAIVTPPQMHIMLDLETLGTAPGSVIVSIGAVKFTREAQGVSGETFYRRIDVESCTRAGLKLDASTVLWWFKQSDAARDEMTKPGDELAVVLHDFALWVNDSNACVWGNGATFDNVLLSAAYDAFDNVGLRRPWSHLGDRCYRTMKNAHRDVPMGERTGTHHNALDDAISQALHLKAIWAKEDKHACAMAIVDRAQAIADSTTPRDQMQSCDAAIEYGDAIARRACGQPPLD